MERNEKYLGGLLVALLGFLGSAFSAPDYSDLSTLISESSWSVTAVVTTGLVATFGIFVLIWGAGKIRDALDLSAANTYEREEWDNDRNRE